MEKTVQMSDFICMDQFLLPTTVTNALYILEQSSEDILKTLIANFMNNFHVRNACCSYKAFE